MNSKFATFALATACCLIFLLMMTNRRANNFGSEKQQRQEEFNLDGCYHVYMDVGSNIGVQVRKLYEPDLYKKAPFIKLFKEGFGSIQERRKHPGVTDTVCAVGFEPNPHHVKILSGKKIIKNPITSKLFIQQKNSLTQKCRSLKVSVQWSTMSLALVAFKGVKIGLEHFKPLICLRKFK